MIDLHSHVLAGLDDGARTLEESLSIAQGAVDAGTKVLAATPHVRDDYPTRPEALEAGLRELRTALGRYGIPLDLVGGGEIAIDGLSRLPLEELRRFGLAGNPDYLLVEFPYVGWPMSLPLELERLHDAGITVVLAHPERNPDVQERPDAVAELVEMGVLVQVTAASFDGRLGRRARAAAFALLERDLVHLVASDAHGPHLRQVGMQGAVEALDDPALAHWLTEQVPRAIYRGGEIPARPSGPERGKRTGRPWFGR